uniref:NADH-ubiquinone oxidoreductase chain 6 n=1 Tax=Kinosternon leucostomum TaxID=641010 RepID=E1U7Z7_9SAUR|nr:NADH dehydrogenase subunit 6 [Kinosternon leucostomum]ACP30424.1 NADH dehydrogenase subunit 6 [Kinosternon leucostomum]
MMYYLFMFGFCYSVWVICMSCCSSPYYGVFSLLFAASFGCGMVVGVGGSFISLVLFLIYLGGMLVIFAYAVSLVEESNVMFYFNVKKWGFGLMYIFIVVCLLMINFWLWNLELLGEVVMNVGGFSTIRLDFSGLAWLYKDGCLMFLMIGWFLLMTLFVVLDLVSDLFRGGVVGH